ncbi:cobyrinate a,c-diamide synthase [Methylocystis sp. SC2]|uniref:cobyrinate a,c-diamide synthase n=1 Tax=Methylocystis sp. (strain SC2) TaxID=187303 RepID=UPI00027AE983|nr:cobyrinate a,c-diamide synthase [Methylocystis sp. SC2]CCJ08565.1 Cobyrinic acid a,c-diamide synthase [Methylocystis sp. SC2]
MNAPGLLIGAARSSSGKTTLTLGLMRALTRRGLRVAPVKCGPDYIDPAFHAAATGRDGVNLDSWAMEAHLIESLAAKVSAGADIVLAEGAMGLFDGAPGGAAGVGASADIAALLGWPVVLIHDVTGQGQTAAAIVRGVAGHDARVKVAGVVLNRVGSERHRRLAGEAIEALGLPVFGALPRNERVSLPERHLGLVQAGETQGLDERLEALADFIEAHVDVDVIVACATIAATSNVIPDASRKRSDRESSVTPDAPVAAVDSRSPAPRASGMTGVVATAPPAQRIAVARDDAFSFFYPHLAQNWRDAGAEVFFFSPLADAAPPEDCDLCWLPGGYPELHAGRLSAAQGFMKGLRRFAQRGWLHGECGGYMVLGRALIDAAGEAHEMAGLLELETSFARRKLHLGYRQARLAADHPLGAVGVRLRGHEFHYATVLREEGAPFALARDAYSDDERPAGLATNGVSGSFFHLLA